jgi:hypothetical protein
MTSLSLFELATKLSDQKYSVIPTKNKKAIIDWKTRIGQIAKKGELREWYSNGNDNSKPKAHEVAILIHNKEFAVDTDGIGETVFREKIIPRLSDGLRKKIKNTTHTKTPHGYHRIFKISEKDFPEGIKTKPVVKFEDHNEIELIGKNHLLIIYGSGYKTVIDIEKIAILSKSEVEELTGKLESFKSETRGIKKVLGVLKNYYKQPNRNNVVFALSGYLHKNRVPESLIHDTIEQLAIEAGDDEIASRLRVVKETCSKDPDGDQVSGLQALRDALDNDNGAIVKISQVFAHIFPSSKFNSRSRVEPDSEEIDDGDDDEDEDNGPHAATTAELLLRLINQNSTLFFKDQYGIPYAYVFNQDHHETVKIGSSRFRHYLIRLYYDSGYGVPNKEAVNNAIQILEATATFQGETIPLSLRVAWNDNGNITYDMTNSKWQCLKISIDGWEIVNDSPRPIFVRHNQIAQVEPDRNYKPNIFDEFLSLTNLKRREDRILLKAYIVSLLIPEIPHVILIPHGGQGSAKTTLLKMIKMLIDPSKPMLLTIYNDVKEFIQQLDHNYIAYFDNLKKAPQWLSDEACKAVTGIGSTKRKLYSDDDDIVYEYIRCLGFSGINISLTEPDALDRSLLIELLRIRPENRMDEKVILSKFYEIRPRLLAYIFDSLTKAIQIKDTIRLDNLPRMADFALWGEAIARAMGYKDLEFINAYYENIGKQNIEAIENHPLGYVIIEYIAEYKSYEGSPSQVLDALESYVIRNPGMKMDTKNKFWPKAPNAFVRRLNQISSNLLDGAGIDVQITRTKGLNGKANMSSIKISQISPISPISPSDQNHEGNSLLSYGDTRSNGDMISPSNKISPSKDIENRAQNGPNGDNGDNGGIVDTKKDDPSAIYKYSCYYCDKAGKKFETNDESKYLKHGAQKHYKKPMFPNLTELKKYGLKYQNKTWEI